MVQARIDAKIRTAKTSSYKHRLRETGKIPAVIYGSGISSEPIELDVKDLENVMHKNGRNALIDLIVKGKQGENKHVVMVKEVQRDPVRREILHADLCKISLNDKIHASVPVVLKGEAAGHKTGGIVQLELRQVEVECLPTEIPDSIAVDISKLEVGDHLNVSDLKAETGFTILNDTEAVVVTVIPPRVEETAGEVVVAGKPENAEEA